MKIYNFIIYTGFSLLILVNTCLVLCEAITKPQDILLLVIEYCTSLLLIVGTYTTNTLIIDIAHVGLGLFLFFGSLFSQNRCMQIVLIIILLLTILSRHYYNGCIIKRLNKKNTTLSRTVKKINNYLCINFYVLYPLLLAIVLIRLV